MTLNSSESPGTGIPCNLKVSYALRRIPPREFATILPLPKRPKAGDIALASMEKLGRNARLELACGRAATLHEGDALAIVFGNRYATEQFEGYAQCDMEGCDLLSMGGVCGTMKSKHAAVSQPTRLRLLGAIGDAAGHPLQLRDFGVKCGPTLGMTGLPKIAVVCGSSMDAGKTHTTLSLIRGLCGGGKRVAGIKLTGTAAGRDTWNFLDAGAVQALDFIDGGWPSTYLCTLEELLSLADALLSEAAAAEVDWIVMEVADGLLQKETSALLQCPRFTSKVAAWLFATGDPLAAVGGVSLLRGWGVEPLVISGLISQSPLGMLEAEAGTGISCMTAKNLQRGGLNQRLELEPEPIVPEHGCERQQLVPNGHRWQKLEQTAR
jgi:hypothetical protein